MVHPGHSSFNMVFNIMMGVKKAVDSISDFPLYELTDNDYKVKAVHQIANWRSYSENTFKACIFFDYAPLVFQQIRKNYGITKAEYSASLGPD